MLLIRDSKLEKLVIGPIPWYTAEYHRKLLTLGTVSNCRVRPYGYQQVTHYADQFVRDIRTNGPQTDIPDIAAQRLP
jgi:hypothetical protein